MKLPDLNVLLYAINEESPHHGKARSWLEHALGGSEPVALDWQVLVGFIRISTHKSILPRPLTIEQALLFVDEALHAPSAQLTHPTDRHALLVGRLLLGAGKAGNLANDAHLAALAIEHDATLVSFDHDFRRFAGLRLELLE